MINNFKVRHFIQTWNRWTLWMRAGPLEGMIRASRSIIIMATSPEKMGQSTMFRCIRTISKMILISRHIIIWYNWEIIKENKLKLIKYNSLIQTWVGLWKRRRLQLCDPRTISRMQGINMWTRTSSGKISTISRRSSWYLRLLATTVVKFQISFMTIIISQIMAEMNFSMRTIMATLEISQLQGANCQLIKSISTFSTLNAGPSRRLMRTRDFLLKENAQMNPSMKGSTNKRSWARKLLKRLKMNYKMRRAITERKCQREANRLKSLSDPTQEVVTWLDRDPESHKAGTRVSPRAKTQYRPCRDARAPLVLHSIARMMA